MGVSFKKPVLEQATTIVAKSAEQRQKLIIRLSQLNNEIMFLRSEIENDLQQVAESGGQPNEALKESLRQRQEEKTVVSTELANLEALLNGELSGLKDSFINERLSVLKAGRNEQDALASELRRAKVTYLENVMNLSDLAKSVFGDVSSYNEIGKLLNITPVTFDATERFPYPVPSSDASFSPYVAEREIVTAHGGDLIYEARSYKQNYMTTRY